MDVPAELRKLSAGLARRLDENARDISAAQARLAELADERRELLRGIDGINEELRTLEGD